MFVIYMDNAATTVTSPEVVDEMLKYFQILYANPSSSYEFAGESRKAVEHARKVIADTIHAKPEEIFFTYGATESDNWALRSVAKACKGKGKHIITSKIEHHAILNTVKNLEDLGYRISYIDVDEKGVIKLQQLIDTIDRETILISIMTANNEVGMIQPVREIGKIAKKYGIIFHTDAVQYYGHLPMNVKELGIHMLSVSAHKFNGPKGIGFLYIDESLDKVPMILGGGQEKGMRSGTENVPSIVGMARAAEIAHENILKKAENLAKKRDYFIRRVLHEIPFTRLNGARNARLPGNLNFCFQFMSASELLAILDLEGICASSGSACSSGSSSPSHVLTAMGIEDEMAYSSVRFTISEENSYEDIDYVIEKLKIILKEKRKDNRIYRYYNGDN